MTMQSRKDLFQAHRLMTQRAALALMRGEPDVPDQPLRRINVGTFSGVLVAVIAVAGFAIWGFLFKSGGTLTYNANTPTVIIDKQTGTDFVFCSHDHQELCPVVNYASALLALQSPTLPATDSVNQSALTGIPHGPEIGIPGLPDVPSSGLLVEQPWLVCTQTRTDVAGIGTQTITTVAAGVTTGGRPLGTNDALLVSDSQGNDWVIYKGKRMLITAGALQVVFNGQLPMTVPSQWMNAIPQGPDFAAPQIQGAGTPVTGPNGNTENVGQVYQVSETGIGTKFFVQELHGQVAGITALEAALLGQQSQSQLVTLTEQELVGHTANPLGNDGLPATAPTPASPAASAPLCVDFSGPGPHLSMQIETGGRMPVERFAPGLSKSSQVFDIDLPPQSGALVQETGNNVHYFLITAGQRFVLPSTAVPAYLGYSTSQAVQLPAGVVGLIPKGPGFYPVNATDTVPVPTASLGSSG